VLSRLPSLGRERWSERLLQGCCVVLALVALWFAVQLAWALVSPAGVPAVATVARGALAVDPRAAVSVAKWHLFGNGVPLRRGSGPGAPPTTLPLILRGTLAERDPKAGFAVIDLGLGREQAFPAGASIAPHVTVSEVYADRVVLLHDGAREVLELPRADRVPSAAVPLTPARTRGGAVAAAGSARGAAAAPQSGGTAPVASSSAGSSSAAALAPASLAGRVRLVPVAGNGKLAGVRLAADSALLARVGLRPTDVVTAVNGVPVDSVARAREVARSIEAQGSAQVSVLRNGHPLEITVDLSRGLVQ
jgi:general secretion pathway protein C